jgi:hypothetical protein
VHVPLLQALRYVTCQSGLMCYCALMAVEVVEGQLVVTSWEADAVVVACAVQLVEQQSR